LSKTTEPFNFVLSCIIVQVIVWHILLKTSLQKEQKRGGWRYGRLRRHKLRRIVKTYADTHNNCDNDDNDCDYNWSTHTCYLFISSIIQRYLQAFLERK